MKEIVRKVAQEVKRRLEGEGTGHDWWHIERVWNNAKRIGKEEAPICLWLSLPRCFMTLRIGSFTMGMIRLVQK